MKTLSPVALAAGSTAVTQPALNSSTLLATTQFVQSINNNASYQVLFDREGSHTAARAAGTYGVPNGGVLPITGVATAATWGAFYFDPADYPTINGINTKLRVRAQLTVNDAAPVASFTFGLYPVTKPAASGAAGLNSYALGAVVAGSNGAVITLPAIRALVNAVGADFVVPVAGHYVLGVVTSAAIAASSHLFMGAQLQLRNA